MAYLRKCYISGKFLTFLTMNVPNTEGKYAFGVVKVGDKGQIVIPKDARKQYSIKPGDTLMMLGDENGMALLKTEVFTRLIGKVMEDILP